MFDLIVDKLVKYNKYRQNVVVVEFFLSCYIYADVDDEYNIEYK